MPYTGIMHVYYNSAYNLHQRSYDTTTKSATIAELIDSGDYPELEIVDPSSWEVATLRLLKFVHDPLYIEGVKTGSWPASFGLPWSEVLYHTALAHSSGVVAAMDEVTVGGFERSASLSSGLHHARFAAGSGFCTFNGLAAAAFYAVERGFRPLILDLDAHGGGGTAECVSDIDDIRQYDIVTTPFDLYENTDNFIQVNAFASSDWRELSQSDYMDTLEEVIEEMNLIQDEFDVILYNAGVDVFDDGISQAVIRARDALVSEFADDIGVSMATVLAGGYTGPHLSNRELAELHLSTLRAVAI